MKPDPIQKVGENKAKAEKRIANVAQEFYSDLASGRLHSPAFVQVVMFNAGRALNESYQDGAATKSIGESWAGLRLGADTLSRVHLSDS